MTTRIEKDTMGQLEVPGDALYGAQTARAVENFPISKAGIGREMIEALGFVKQACAAVNRDLGKLEPVLAGAIVKACEEVVAGKLDAHFPVDVFQTGSGTSSNMNVNEVISNRAIQMLGGNIGSKDPIHPNDHVNMGQSSNDVFPTAIHVAATKLIEKELVPSLEHLRDALARKSSEMDHIVKIGRTHLQDATPIRLGQEFSGFAAQIDHGVTHVRRSLADLRELAIGGTAVGTGLNTHPEFGARVSARLFELTGLEFKEASNHFEAHAARDAAVRMSGALRSVAISCIKIANDIRWLGSGPRLGLGELRLPAVQPGSSIMPGKVNPVIAEALIQVGAQVVGNDAAIGVGGMLSPMQLNVMQPLIARNLLEQARLLARATRVFADKLVDGLQADEARIGSMVEQSLSLATPLAPHVGYDKAAEIAKRADKEGRTVREVAVQMKVLPEDELSRVLDLRSQTHPSK